MNLKELHLLIDACLAPKYEPSPELHLERCQDLKKRLSEVNERLDKEIEAYKNKPIEEAL